MIETLLIELAVYHQIVTMKKIWRLVCGGGDSPPLLELFQNPGLSIEAENRLTLFKDVITLLAATCSCSSWKCNY